MNTPAVQWETWYAPLLGRKLQAVAFLSLQPDTPDLVAALDGRLLDFNGATQLVFEPDDNLYLTWAQFGFEFGLFAGNCLQDLWRPHALDTIHRSAGWDNLENATLRSVGFYGCDVAQDADLIVAAAHRFDGGPSPVTLWVSTGFNGKAGAGDDMVVSLDAEPPAESSLTLKRTVQ